MVFGQGRSEEATVVQQGVSQPQVFERNKQDKEKTVVRLCICRLKYGKSSSCAPSLDVCKWQTYLSKLCKFQEANYGKVRISLMDEIRLTMNAIGTVSRTAAFVKGMANSFAPWGKELADGAGVPHW